MLETFLLITKLLSLLVQIISLLFKGISALKRVKGLQVLYSKLVTWYSKSPFTKRKG